eukprot:COSAG06_NODE_7731_length_2395_cov_3.002612_2_plen_54_part_00
MLRFAQTMQIQMTLVVLQMTLVVIVKPTPLNTLHRRLTDWLQARNILKRLRAL